MLAVLVRFTRIQSRKIREMCNVLREVWLMLGMLDKVAAEELFLTGAIKENPYALCNGTRGMVT